MNVERDLEHVRSSGDNGYRRRRSWRWVCKRCAAASALTTYDAAHRGLYRHKRTQKHRHATITVPAVAGEEAA